MAIFLYILSSCGWFKAEALCHIAVKITKNLIDLAEYLLIKQTSAIKLNYLLSNDGCQ